MVDRTAPEGGTKALELSDATASAVNIFWTDQLSGWNDAWTLSGLFYTTAIPTESGDGRSDAFHDHLVCAGSTREVTFVVSAYDPYDEAFEPVRIKGQSVDTIETKAPGGSIEEETWYRYELSFDGTDTYRARRWPARGDRSDGLAVESTGSPPGDRNAGLIVASGPADDEDDPLTVAHDYMEWRREGTDRS